VLRSPGERLACPGRLYAVDVPAVIEIASVIQRRLALGDEVTFRATSTSSRVWTASGHG
jgi:hypothetical protein